MKTKAEAVEKLLLLRAYEEDIVEYIRLSYLYNRTAYSMRNLVNGAVGRKLMKCSRLGAVGRGEAHTLLQQLEITNELICFLLDLDNSELLDVLHHHYIDLYSINQYHVLYFCLHYKKETDFRQLLGYGYSVHVLNRELLEVMLENRYCLEKLFKPQWSYRRRKSVYFDLDRHEQLLHKHLQHFEEQLTLYCQKELNMDYKLLNLLITAKAMRSCAMYDFNIVKYISTYLI